LTNQPEKPHFDRIMRVERERLERVDDLKALWASAKDALDKDALKDLKVAVRRALADPDKLAETRAREDRADALLASIGPLGEAAVRAAQ